MTIENFYEVFSKFVWPLALGYAGYVHRQYALLSSKVDDLAGAHHEHVASVNKEFAPRSMVAELESKLTAVLNRIDDKVTRILEREIK